MKGRLLCTLGCSQCCVQDSYKYPVFKKHEQGIENEIQVDINAIKPNEDSDLRSNEDSGDIEM